MWPWVQGEDIYAVMAPDQILFMQCDTVTQGRVMVRWQERIPIQLTSAGLLSDMPGIQHKLVQILQYHTGNQQALHILLMPPLATESLVACMHHTASLTLLAPEMKAHQHYWYHALGPYEEHYLFYLAYAARALLLQLELLVLDTPVCLASIRVRFLVQKGLYQFLKGSAYRHVEQVYAIDQERIDLLHHCRSLLERLCDQVQHDYDDLFMHALSMRMGDQEWNDQTLRR